MTEQQWLQSTNPSEMYAFIRGRITERQMQFLSEAGYNLPDFRLDAGDNILRDCNLLREIVGNPVRQNLLCGCEGFHKWKHKFGCDEGLSILEHNDSAIPKMVREILEEPCLDCENGWVTAYRGEPSQGTELVVCQECKHTGFVSRIVPQWSLMPELSKLLVEAGCPADSPLVLHCRVRDSSGHRKVTHVVGCWVLELLGGER